MTVAGDHLLRSLAPLPHGAWDRIDEEARTRLEPALAARRVVDFAGPLGWTHSATILGRTGTVTGSDGLEVRRRRVLPLVEVRVPFVLSRQELFAADRGAADPDLGDLARAAHRMAVAENAAVFHGWAEAGVDGIVPASPHPPVPRVPEFEDYPRRVARAVTTLLENGVGGPYALVLGPAAYAAVIETAEHGGYPLWDHVRKILEDGPVVWAPGVRGGVVLSLRSGDFLFESGQDLSVGFDRHDGDDVHLYLEQSFSFRVATPEAAIALASAEQPMAEQPMAEQAAAETTTTAATTAERAA